jgi:hypothetical protein
MPKMPKMTKLPKFMETLRSVFLISGSRWLKGSQSDQK